jgi:Protein of unknown function (DUF1499)
MRFVLWALVLVFAGLGAAMLYAKWRSPADPFLDAFYKLIAGPPDRGYVDLKSFSRGSTNNTALAAPANFWTGGKPDIETNPVALLEAEILSRLEATISRDGSSFSMVEERREPDGLMRRYVVRTPLMRFPDTLTIRLVAGANGTGIALYTASQLGSRDQGTNRKRIEAILAALK